MEIGSEKTLEFASQSDNEIAAWCRYTATERFVMLIKYILYGKLQRDHAV